MQRSIFSIMTSGFLFAFTVNFANAAGDIPFGSYQYTCSNEKVDINADTLTARCEKLGGSPLQQTTLTGLNQCLYSLSGGGDIANIDGNLICMPDLPLASRDMVFPMPETTINGWIYNNNQDAIYGHGWEIWSGLTQNVGKIDGSEVRAFETWLTPDLIIYKTDRLEAMAAKDGFAPTVTPDGGLKLGIPKQFHHQNPEALTAIIAEIGSKTSSSSSKPDTNVFESVAYNPAAAKHAISNKLFLKSTLNNYVKQGYTNIPDFPASAITIKPVYKVINTNTLPEDMLYTFPGWPGTPFPAKAFPESDWNACVYVDVTANGSSNANAIDVGCQNRGKPQHTFHLDDFIHQKLSQEDVDYLNQQLGLKAQAGNYAILVGMHVTTRETKRWTWQTFFWSANADAPYSPSSASIAAARLPYQLDSASKHYAMAIGYQMISPAQPIRGGKNEGSPVIAYNPHLEAGFDTSTFGVKPRYSDLVVGDDKHWVGKYGVETGCMSCHNLASFKPPKGADTRVPGYSTDFYLSISDEIFNGLLRTDFAWSIPDRAK